MRNWIEERTGAEFRIEFVAIGYGVFRVNGAITITNCARVNAGQRRDTAEPSPNLSSMNF